MSEIDWTLISRRLGMRDAAAFARREIAPLLENAPVEKLKKDGARKNPLELPITIGFFGFGAAFIALVFATPDRFIGVALRFLLFFPLFFISLAAALYVFRGRLAAALTDGRARFLARSKALGAVAEALGLVYAPAPGGAPQALQWLAKRRWAPAELKEAATVLDAHGGMDAPLEIARASGVMTPNAAVIGDRRSREKYLAQQAALAQVEDGFQGVRAGVPFSAFEWVESVDNAADVYHLVMTFTAPRKLYGVTQLRSRRISWPSESSEIALKSVGVVAPAFENRFRIRSTDQVEARAVFDPAVLERVAVLAGGDDVRAVAFDNHLVIDVAGEDRFAMVDLVTGAWSEETIARSMTNIADMLDLASAVAHAFKLRAAA